MVLKIVKLLLLMLPAGSLFAQSDRMGALGLGLNRYGVSFHFKHYAPQKADESRPVFKDWAVEIGNVQHPREVALLNNVFQSSGVYKLDKINYLWALRPTWQGRKPLSLRQERKAIGMNAIWGAGLTMAYHWPVYVLVLQVDASGNESFETVRYNPDEHPQSSIGGRASFTRGISEGNVIPGLLFQGGFEFLWGNYRTDANIVTIGARVEAFPRKLPILHTDNLNRSVFSTFYVNFAFGLGE